MDLITRRYAGATKTGTATHSGWKHPIKTLKINANPDPLELYVDCAWRNIKAVIQAASWL
jgi:hypothetical protein